MGRAELDKEVRYGSWRKVMEADGSAKIPRYVEKLRFFAKILPMRK